MSDLKNKYFGLLSDFDFDKINKKTFSLLIEKGIFDEFDLSRTYSSEKDYFGIELSNDLWDFSNFFLFRKKEYHLKKQILDEMIARRKNFLESFYDYTEIEEIEILISKELLVENKIRILDEKHSEYFDLIKNKPFYPLYINNANIQGYDTWQQYCIEGIIFDENFDFVVAYLKGNENYIPIDLKRTWDDYFVFSKISNFCQEKKVDLLNIKTKVVAAEKKIDLHLQVSLLERIMRIEDWENITPNKKGEIISQLLGGSATNIRKFYSELEKNNTDTSSIYHDTNSKYSKDIIEADQIIKRILG